MSLLRSFRLSTYLTLAMACLCLGYAEGDLLPETPYITAVVIVLIAVAHRVEGRWSLSLQSANSVGAVLAVALIAWIAFQFMRGSPGLIDILPFPGSLLPYLGPVLMILIPAKLFRPKHIGDYWAIHGIGLLAVTLGCSMASDFFFSVLMIAYVFCFAWSLVLFYLYREIKLEKFVEECEHSRTPVRLELLRATAIWTIVVAAASVLLFLATPRPAERKWDLSLAARGRMEVGLSEGAVDLNRTGSLETNNEIAFEVYADNVAGKPKLDLPLDQRWRSHTLSQYDGGRWVRERTSGLTLLDRTIALPRDRSGRPMDQDRRIFRNSRLPNFGPETFYLTYTLHQHVGGSSIIADPVVWRPLDAPPIYVFNTRSGAVQQHPDGRFEWINLHNPGRPSYCQVTTPLREQDLSPPLRVTTSYQDFLTWISSNDMADRMRRWTNQVLEGLVAEGKLPASAIREVDPLSRHPLDKHHEAIARALEKYLANSEEFTYTLELDRQDKSIDPVEDFLYNTKSGHCQRFASALVMMLRSQGIPAQLVIGFRGCESHDDGRYIVRQSSAHAWVEALIPRSPPANLLPPRNSGPYNAAPSTEAHHWLTLDPTPTADSAARSKKGFASWLEKVQIWGESFFRNFILGYDATAREQAIAMISDSAKSFGYDLISPDLNTAKGITVGFLLMLAIAVSLWRRRRDIRRGRSRRRQLESRKPPEVLPFYRRLLALLAPHGQAPQTGQTTREFTSHVMAWLSSSGIGVDLNSIADATYRIHFGQQPLSTHESQEIEETLNRLETALRSLANRR